jgi:quercetin dioxygenase-like cupin family protein
MSRKLTVMVVALLIAAVSVTTALATPALGGFLSTLLARGTLTTPVNANADGVKLRTHGSIDHAVSKITIPPGGSSGWHRHPGVVLVTVQTGTLARYDSHCNRDEFSAGQSFWEAGLQPLVVRNETHSEVINYVTFIAPTGSALRIDTPNPGCPVE